MQANPIQALREGGLGQNKGNNIEGIFTLTLTPIKDLSVKAVGGIRYKNEQIKDWRAEYGKYGPLDLDQWLPDKLGLTVLSRKPVIHLI